MNELVGPCNDKWIDEIEQYYTQRITQRHMPLKEAQQKIDEATWIPGRIQRHIKNTVGQQVEEEKRQLEAINRQIRKIRRTVYPRAPVGPSQVYFRKQQRRQLTRLRRELKEVRSRQRQRMIIERRTNLAIRRGEFTLSFEYPKRVIKHK